jgi:formylglycine-generating enzyme required for sulfatase activity
MAQPKIFVSHSHKDDAFTERLVEDLCKAGADAWMDKTDLGAGNFQQRISEALADCEWFVLVLTRDALASPWVRQEVDAANRLKNQGQIHDLIFIQAEPLEHRELPALWGVFNIFDAVTDYVSARDHTLQAVGLEKQASSLKRLADLDFAVHIDGAVEYMVPPFCVIPTGPFLMGDDKHIATLSIYEMARYPVTVAEYAYFVRAGQHAPSDWQKQLSRLDHPIVSVSWHDAIAYATWLLEQTGQIWRLPSDEEWEKAARGTDGRAYPWGDTFDQTRCNTRESGLGSTTPVGSYKDGGSIVLPNGQRREVQDGSSPYGVADLAGNVWEWTETRYDDSTENLALRGGTWGSGARFARTAARYHAQPTDSSDVLGFRLVRGAPNT